MAEDHRRIGRAWRLVLALVILFGPLLAGSARGIGLQAILDLTVDEGSTAVITSDQLEVITPITDRNAIIYTLEAAPLYGSLKRGAIALVSGDTFTQAEVDGGQLSYAHAGGEVPTDTFHLTIANATTTIRASIRGTTQGNNDSFDPSISQDGKRIVFRSFANNFAPNDTNGSEDIFYYDLETATLSRVSQNSDGVGGNSSSVEPAISGDGRFVAFDSSATNLLPKFLAVRRSYAILKQVLLNG
jgi:hypothetical protein